MSGPAAAGALASGDAFVDLSSWRKVGVSGRDAVDWLNDLLTPDLAGLQPNGATRALLLGPTGGIRADVTVVRIDRSVVLLQDPSQPSAIDRILAPYVLSSDVELADRTEDLCLIAFPGRDTAPDVAGTVSTTPSCLGPGVDLTAPSAEHGRILASLSPAFEPVTEADVEAWRIATGIPRFGVDALPDDLPQEAGLVSTVSFDKGCYLGQEAVAKVQNLGHPRRLVLHLAADAPVEVGEALLSDRRDVGVVTSVAPTGSGAIALARVRWDAREDQLATPSGVGLRRVAGS